MELFNRHYGVWSEFGPRPGQPVEMSLRRFHELHGDPDKISMYSQSKEIGQYNNTTFEYKTSTVIWINQLVVHQDYRRQGVAKTLVSWLPKSDYLGVASANKVTIGLVKGTPVNQEKFKEIIESCPIPFIKNNTTQLSAKKIYSNFFIESQDPSLFPGQEYIEVVKRN
jgi:hypothetical protein